MKTLITSIFIAIALSSCSSKPNNVTGDASQTDQSQPAKEPCHSPCTYVVYDKKMNIPPIADHQLQPVSLSPGENTSLNNALEAAAQTKQSDPHVHANVVEGKLEFTADKAGQGNPAEQVPENSPKLQIANKGAQVKMMASPEAIKLLNQHAGKGGR